MIFKRNWLIVGTLTSSVITGQSGDGSNDKRYSLLIRAPELEPHHQIKFNAISRTPFSGRGLTLFWRIQSAYSNPQRQGTLFLNFFTSKQCIYVENNIFWYSMTFSDHANYKVHGIFCLDTIFTWGHIWPHWISLNPI